MSDIMSNVGWLVVLNFIVILIVMQNITNTIHIGTVIPLLMIGVVGYMDISHVHNNILRMILLFVFVQILLHISLLAISIAFKHCNKWWHDTILIALCLITVPFGWAFCYTLLTDYVKDNLKDE